MTLKEWSMIYLKHRDILKREIVELLETPEGYSIIKKNSTEKVVVQEQLDKNVIGDIVITLNTANNVTTIAHNWTKYVDKNPLVIFANPSTNEKWLLRPTIHARIADESTLLQGLMSMYENITVVT